MSRDRTRWSRLRHAAHLSGCVLDANRVAYKAAAPGGKAMDPADIADAARAMSAFVVCR